MPRFDQSFTGLCEQNLQDTLQLKQRYLVDAKSKRVPKSKDKKQQESIQSSVHVQQKFLKRPSEEPDPSASVPNDNFDPPVKLQCTTQQHGSHQNDGLTKFSVEIVQQLEFTTSAANSQPQQISTNVTVKAHTNASVKSDVSSPKSNPSTPASNLQKPNNNIGLVDVGTLVECVKQEPDNDFADLDQCAAALEKDAAANGGAAFGGFTDFIGEDTSDEIMSSAAFKDLISDITTNYPDYPELMKFDFEGSKFDFEDKPEVNGNNLKVEETANDNTKNTHSPLVQNQNNYSPPVFENNQNVNKPRPNNMSGYSNMDFAKTELSPAAQTLKQMAEQHQQQHKNQMGLSFNPNARAAPASRSPYPDFQFQGDYGSPNSNTFHKNSPSFTQPDGMIKQEMIFQNNEYDMKRKGATMYKQQQYSPYNSPSASSHGSPSYLPRGGNGAPGNGPAAAGSFRTGTPPRPPSGPGGNGGPGATLQINQAQQLNISQQNHGHAIQLSAGQHLHLSGDLKGNVSIAAQQGLHFNQQQHCSPNNGGPPQNQPQQPPPPTNPQQNPQQNPLPTQHSQQHQSASSMPPNMNSQHSTMNQNAQSVPQSGNNMMSGGQQMPNSQHGPMGGPGNMPGGMGGMVGGPGGMQQHSGGMPGNLGDGYSMSQTQTINFTQQTLRRSGGPGGVPAPMPTNGPMGPGPMVQGGMGPRLINAQALDQQKLLHQQQQLLRAQQAAMQQHMVRPPPPDYKTSAGMIQGVPPRYAPGPPPNIRRMPHQPMPPSGPMIRSNMYMIQQQQQQELQQQQRLAQQRNMYPRQPGPPIGGMDSIQHGSTEWRHLVMQQQQNSSFNPMRPNFQQGFGMNSGNMQMSALQHQQIRTQQGMVAGGMSGGGAQQGMAGQGQVMAPGPMAQMNNMSQAMLHMQQQNMMQQNSQMSMTNLHLQQSQSVTVSNQGMPQQQQQQHPNISGHMANNPNNQLQQAQQQQQQQQQQNSALNNFNPQADFTFEFLDTLPTTDSGGFTDQELLNSFDTDAGFTLDF